MLSRWQKRWVEMRRQEKERRAWSEVWRETASITKVRWQVKEKSNWWTGSTCANKERKRGRKTSGQVSQHCQALRLAGYCKKLSWCYTNVPIMILACELVYCVYDVYCSVQTMLFIYIATAATFFYCFRRCCHFFSPKDKYFILVLLSQISEIMQCLHVLPNTGGQVWREQKQVRASETDQSGSAGRSASQKY